MLYVQRYSCLRFIWVDETVARREMKMPEVDIRRDMKVRLDDFLKQQWRERMKECFCRLL